MPTTSPFFIQPHNRVPVRIVDVYEYRGRPWVRVKHAEGRQFFGYYSPGGPYGKDEAALPAGVLHIDADELELAHAKAIAAAHPLNPEGAYERILERERRREACCPKCGHHRWSDYEIEVEESPHTFVVIGYETRCHGCGYTADPAEFWSLTSKQDERERTAHKVAFDAMMGVIEYGEA